MIHFVKGFCKAAPPCHLFFIDGTAVVESTLLKNIDLLHIFLSAGLKCSMYVIQYLLFTQKMEQLKVKNQAHALFVSKLKCFSLNSKHFWNAILLLQ